MGASSLTFSAGSRGRQRELAEHAGPKPVRGLTTAATKSNAPATANAPSVTLPLQFILTGIVALLLGMAGLVWRPELLATYHYNQYVIALTHLFVLGWICSVVMGAVYQLVPVALETRLHSERLARWQFVFHAVGFAGMVWMFWRWDLKQVGHFASALALGVGLFAYNIARTLARVPRWNVVAGAVATALFWLGFAVFAGLCVAAAKCAYESAANLPPTSFLGAMLAALQAAAGFVKRFDQMSVMHAHAHLGVLGFFIMLIVGVSYKLVPMFTLSELQSRRRAAWSVVLLNVGLAGLFVTVLLRNPWKLAFALVVMAGLALYGLELRAILSTRKRPALDWGLRTFLTAVSLLAPLSVLAVVLSWPGLPLTPFTGQLENLYGVLALLGVVSLAILGMLYKVIPFLVWFGRYSREIGRRKVPSMGDLYSHRLQAVGYWLYLAGLATVCAGTVLGHANGVRSGAVLLTTSVAVLAVNVAKMLSHFWPAKFQPLPTVQPKVETA